MTPNLLRDVVAVRYVRGERIWLRFEDGVEGEIDLREVVREAPGALAQLRDPAFVARVRVHPESGTVTWPGDVDLDPVVLYCAVRGVPLPSVGSRAARPTERSRTARRARPKKR